MRDARQAMLDAWEGRVASDVEGPDLAALRDSMIHRDDADGGRFTQSVKTVNDRLFVIKQAFRWAREARLVSHANMFDLMSVAPLKAGRCAARPPMVILPVDEHWVAVTKPHCASPVRAMIDLQWLTGMRPGEATIMRACDIDTSGGDVWLYTPREHKMEHKGKLRVIPLGPRAQAGPFLERPTDA